MGSIEQPIITYPSFIRPPIPGTQTAAWLFKSDNLAWEGARVQMRIQNGLTEHRKDGVLSEIIRMEKTFVVFKFIVDNTSDEEEAIVDIPNVYLPWRWTIWRWIHYFFLPTRRYRPNSQYDIAMTQRIADMA